MGHREVAPSLVGSTWSFSHLDAGVVNGSILDVFVDPRSAPPGQASELVDTGAGRVQLAVAATAQGGGVTRYAYALMNFDFERRIQSFSVPVGPGQVVTGTGFGDANGNALDDWSASVGAQAVTWSAPAGNALDWGTLYNFRMDVTAPPGPSAAVLTPLEPGFPSQVAVQTLPEPGAGPASGCALALLALLARRRARLPAGRAGRP
jgi:hypothetical protein